MGCTLAEAKARTPEREFRQWLVWYAREPSVGDRIDELGALLTAAAFNAAPFRDGRPVDPVRFLPRRWGAPRSHLPDRPTLAAKLTAWGMALASKG